MKTLIAIIFMLFTSVTVAHDIKMLNILTSININNYIYQYDTGQLSIYNTKLTGTSICTRIKAKYPNARVFKIIVRNNISTNISNCR